MKENTSGFFDGAEYITIRNRSVHWGDNRPGYFNCDLDSAHVNSLEIVDFTGTSAFPSKYDAIKNRGNESIRINLTQTVAE